MRLSNLLRLLTLALLLMGTLAIPAVDTPGFVATADDGGDDDGDEGRGNDDDDDDNEGEGNNNRNDDKDDDPDDGNAGRGNDDKDGDDNVTAAAAYVVEVACEPTGDGAETTCIFSPAEASEGKEVSQLLVPEDILCSEVVATEAEYVDPDPNMHETGYKSRGNDGVVTLELDGSVQAAGTATYWVKAAGTVYPATGAGLSCDVAATLDNEGGKATPDPTAPPVTTGTVVVHAFACLNVPADRAGFDWYGACDPDTAAHRYLLAQDTAATNPLLAAQTDETGAATFADLAPGAYHLDDADARWCKAESDNVNTDGNVVVEAGATTTVWLFFCHEGGS